MSSPTLEQARQEIKSLASLEVQLALVPDATKQTTVYDPENRELFVRTPLGTTAHGYLDTLSQLDRLGSLLRVVVGQSWDASSVLTRIAKAGYSLGPAGPRFICYRYPRLAVQVRLSGGTLVLLDIEALVPVAPADVVAGGGVRAAHPPGQAVAGKAVVAIGRLQTCAVSPHGPGCFSPTPQDLTPWCVAACVQMLLDYQSIERSQADVALAIGLGTPTTATYLISGHEGQIVAAVNSLSNGRAVASLEQSPQAYSSVLLTELDANRPVLLLAGGHARMVIGYTYQSRPGVGDDLKLKIYDPEPVAIGTLVPWERFLPAAYSGLVTCQGIEAAGEGLKM
jgi:hypothetical protein